MLPPGRSPGAEARNYRAQRRPTAGAGAREARTRKTPRPERRQQKGQRGCQRTTDNRPTGERRQGRESPTACQRRKGGIPSGPKPDAANHLRARDTARARRTAIEPKQWPAPLPDQQPRRNRKDQGHETPAGDSPKPATPKWTDPPAHGVRGEGCRINPKTRSVCSEPTPKGKARPRTRDRSPPYHTTATNTRRPSPTVGGERAEAVQPDPKATTQRPLPLMSGTRVFRYPPGARR